MVQTIFGPPGLLLYGVKSVVIHLNFNQQAFDWVDLGKQGSKSVSFYQVPCWKSGASPGTSSWMPACWPAQSGSAG